MKPWNFKTPLLNICLDTHTQTHTHIYNMDFTKFYDY